MPFLATALLILAQASSAVPPALAKPDPPSMFNPPVLAAMAILIVAFIFLIKKPQEQEQKAKLKAAESMKKGDRVISIGGIHGTVVRVNKDKETVVVQVAKAIELEFNKTAVTVQVDSAKPDADKKDES